MGSRIVSFLCAECGEQAGTVGVVTAGGLVDLGRPFGMEPADRDSVTMDYLGIKVVERVEPQAFTQLARLFDEGPPEVKDVDEVLRLPFFCRRCGAAYCKTHWAPIWPIFEEGGFYDRSEGTCPRGHVATVDD